MTNQNQGSYDKVLNKGDILALAFGAMIGWMWVWTTGTWILAAGVGGAVLAILCGALIVTFVAFCYAELSPAMPIAGAELAYSIRTMGNRQAFIAEWFIIFGCVSVAAFETVAFPTVLAYVFPGYETHGYMWTLAGWDVYASWVAVGVVGTIIFTFLNYRGVSVAALVNKILTLVLALVGIAFVGGTVSMGDAANIAPVFTDMNGFFLVLGMTPLAYVGFNVIPQTAAEINLPYRLIGKILMLSVVMATAWYALITFGVGMALNNEEIAYADANGLATLEAAIAVYGRGVTLVIITGGLCGILTSWIGFFMGGARAISAMARAKMLPEFLGKIHPVYKTPTNAVILIGAITCLTPLLGRKVGVWLIDAGSAGIVFSWFFVCYAFIKLRKHEPDLERPYRAPGGSMMGVLGMIACAFMCIIFLPGMPSALVWPYEWALMLGWIVLGVIFSTWAKSTYGAITREWRYEQIFGEKPKKLY